jgi:ABC-2 type transport system ATP-binding protein
VIFSTHQMDLAQRLCDRLVLINRGRKLIEGSLEEIRGRFTGKTLIIEGRGDLAPLARLPGVADAEVAAGRARLSLRDGGDAQAALRQALACGEVTRFEIQRPDLHEIFVRLVGDDGATPLNPPVGRGDGDTLRAPRPAPAGAPPVPDAALPVPRGSRPASEFANRAPGVVDGET